MTQIDPRIAARRRVVQESHARRSLHRLVRVLVVLAVAAAVVWAFRSPLLSVQQIDVRGAERVDVASVLRSEGLAIGLPMMDADLDAATAALRDDPWVIEASVTRDWPQSIVVEMDERIPVAWVAVDDGWVHAAVDGVPLDASDAPAIGAPVLIAPAVAAADIPQNPDLVGMLEFLDSLPTALQNEATVQVGGDGFEGVVGGYLVRLGSGEKGREKALTLAALIDTVPEEGSIITVVAPAQPAILPPGSEASSKENPEEG